MKSMESIALSIVNCKIIKHCFDGLFGVEDLDTSPDDHRGIVIQFTDKTHVFEVSNQVRREIDVDKYFKDVKDGLWIWINKTKESDGRFWNMLCPTTKVYYSLNKERFELNNEVSLDDADMLLDPEKEYVAHISVNLRERKWHRDESDKYVAYAKRIAIKEARA